MAHGLYEMHVSTEVNAGRKLVPNRRRKVLFISFPKFISLCNQSSLPDYKSLHRMHQSLSYWIFQVKHILLWVGFTLGWVWGRDGAHSAVRTGARRARGALRCARCRPSVLAHRGEAQGFHEEGRHSYLHTPGPIPVTACWRIGPRHRGPFPQGLRRTHNNSDHTRTC